MTELFAARCYNPLSCCRLKWYSCYSAICYSVMYCEPWIMNEGILNHKCSASLSYSMPIVLIHAENLASLQMSEA